MEVDGPRGPATARNRAAAIAKGDILVFVDADVIVERSNLPRITALFAGRPDVAAVFGAYDEDPPERNLVSQYKNLAHSYIHQSSNAVAQTFWAGFGAVRAEVFRSAGGFDERFRRPSVEDIDLGYRLTAAGYLVLLDHELRVRHLKHWTLGSLLVTDIRDRGVPWTQLIHRYGRTHNDLNIRSTYRVSVAFSYVLVALLLLSVFDPRSTLAAGAVLAMLYWLNRRFYAYFIRHRGVLFAVRIVPLHLMYQLYNGVSFVVGTTLFVLAKHGIHSPWTLPLTAWDNRMVGPVSEGSVEFEHRELHLASPRPTNNEVR